MTEIFFINDAFLHQLQNLFLKFVYFTSSDTKRNVLISLVKEIIKFLERSHGQHMCPLAQFFPLLFFYFIRDHSRLQEQ